MGKKSKDRSGAAKKGRGSSGQNRKIGEDFLLKNSKKNGVIVTHSGLQYIIRDQDGEGKKSPNLDSTIKVNQRIMLVDGTVIHDSYQRGEPDVFTMQEAIAGLKEGIQLMSENDRFRFFVPPELAWGKRGAGDKIGPYAVLIFDIRLINIID